MTRNAVEDLSSDLLDLRKQFFKARHGNFRRAWVAMAREYWSEELLDESLLEPKIGLERLQGAIDRIEKGIQQLDLGEDLIAGFEEGDWSLGGEFEVFAPREILRGFVVPVREVPVAVKLSTRAMAFITIGGEADILDRHLFQGIHYHYALADGTHTTTMICWDTRWTIDRTQKPVDEVRSLFHELHAVGAKSTPARPNLWGTTKRESIWEACKPDLNRWPDINTFRCASDKAIAVWRTSAVLTPLVSSVKLRHQADRRK